MDNGDSLLDVIDDTSDLFGNHNDNQGLFNWADEFLSDEGDISSSAVTAESGNLATNVNQPSLLLTSQNYAITPSIPSQNIAIASSQFLTAKAGGSSVMTQQKSAVVNQAMLNSNQSGITTQILQQGNQQFIVRTPTGGRIQLNRQQQQQVQQVLQQQQQQGASFHQILAPVNSASQSAMIMSQSATQNSVGGLTFSGSGGAVTHTVSQMRASPAPNINLVHLPQTAQQQQHTSQQQQFQLAPGTILQIPTASGASQNLSTTLIQGQHAFLGQQGTLVNAQNTVIQNPNVVNVNVAAQHVLCSNPAQQQRTSLGLTQSPFNIQGTLIQTAEGKSILIPSQNIAQPINLQGLSVATPLAQPQIQQQTQGGVSNMLQIAQQQQQQQTTSNQGLQQIVLNHQGQQILVQRAPSVSGQPQNIILRTASGQSGVLQLQQRAGQGTQVQSAQQTLQALAAGGSGQQLHLVTQQGSTQQGVPVINIGGQNVTLQQLSSQLGNLQGLQIQQSQTQVGQVPKQQTVQQQQDHMTFSQGHLQQGQTGAVTFSQGQINMTPQSYSSVVSQPKMSVAQGTSQNQTDNSVNSVENQTRLILQQIHNSLKKSQANAQISAAANVSTIQAMHGSAMNIKQEYGSSSVATSVNTNVPLVSVKSESNLLEGLIKQESNRLASSCVTQTSAHGLLTSSSLITQATTTLSQATTQMSLFVLSNSQNVQSSNVSTNFSSTSQSSSLGQLPGTNFMPKAQTVSVNSSAFGNQSAAGVAQLSNQSITRSVQGLGNQSATGSGQGMATLQTIHLPPELQQQFQRVQEEIRKVQAMTNITQQQKQEKLQQLQIFQKRILLKGHVLATTKADPQQLQQSLTTFTQAGLSYSSPVSSVQSASSTIAQIKASLQASSELSSHGILSSSAGQFSPASSNEGLKNLLRQETHTQPDSTSSLGQDSQIHSASQSWLGSSGISSPSSVTQQQFVQSNQQLSTAVGQNIATPLQSVASSSQGSSQGQGQVTPAPASASVPQVAVPTQIKIADKVLTLSLTPAQKEKVQSYLDRMTPEQQMQYLQTQQHVLQKIMKQQALNAQIRAQVEAQKKQAAANAAGVAGTMISSDAQGQISVSAATGQTVVSDPAPVTSTSTVGELRTIPVPVGNISAQPTETTTPTLLRGQKRSYMDIPKGTLINQQIRQDQNQAVKPNTKMPFRSRGDACRRLLRYHVFQQYGPSQDEFDRFDGYMEDIADELLKKKDRMFEKFRQLLFQETLRVQPSSELVMLQRMQNQDLRKTLEEEKLQIKVNPELFKPMPMKYLTKQQPDDKETTKDGVQIKQENEVSVQMEEKNENAELKVKVEVKSELEDSEDDENLESRAAKMRKLVIKTDGMSFSSSFKRMSTEGSQSSAGDHGEAMDESDTNDYDTNLGSVDVKKRTEVGSVELDDDDTNEYSKDMFDNEAAEAAMIISSTENSQDTQDSSLDTYGVDHNHLPTQNGINFYRNKRNFEIAHEPDNDSDDSESHLEVRTSRHSSVTNNKQNMPVHRMSNSAFDNLLDTADGDDSDIDDKFDMYQPITECLTDSEENSYYSADNTLDQKTIVIDDDDDDLGQGHWAKTDAQKTKSNSEDEPDPDVEAQMESAINSILSLSHGGATGGQDSIFTCSYSQSDPFFDSQSDALFGNSHDLQAELNFQTDQSKGRDNENGRSSEEIGSDLDAAVNSILM